MKQKKSLVITVLVLILILGGAYLLYQRLAPSIASEQLSAQNDGSASQQEVISAPDFTVYDQEGNEIHLSDYLGKPVVLNFWASWCGPCKSEMPDFHDAYKELGEEVQFLMVNVTQGRETMETARAFLEEQAYEFPVAFDTDGNAALTYGAYSLPTTYFIDAQGNAIARATGALSAETLQKGIDMIYFG